MPVGKKVRVLLTAGDVIHAWWVPAFGMKKDAIPGFVNEIWFRADKVGIYRGQCAELCGRDHGFMPVVVDVKLAGGLRQPGCKSQQDGQKTASAPRATCRHGGVRRSRARSSIAQPSSPPTRCTSTTTTRITTTTARTRAGAAGCYATNHKDIGTMYLLFSLLMFFVGGTMAMVIRAELFQPGLQLVDPMFFNSMTTMHALIMIFGAVMPAFVGLANWMIPLQVGAPDMALPRMNNFSFWILPFAFTLLLGTLFVPGGAPAGGWTMYPPLSLQTGDAFPMLIFAVHLMGASSIMGAINVIVTIMNMRAPGMSLLKMPMFVWSWLITAYLLIAVMPVLAGAVTMLLTDHYLRHDVLRSRGRRRPGDVPAHLLVLRASRGLHHDPAGVRHRLGDHPDVLAQAAVRLRLDGVRDRLDRVPVVHRLGAPHVHGRHAARRPAVLHAGDDADRGADRREGVQLDRDDVQGLADVRAADAVRARRSCSCSRSAASPA